MAYDIGPKIGIEGEKEFRDGIKAINETVKTLGTEMKAVTSQYDKNDQSVEALTAKNEVLNKQIEAQKQKLAELAKGLDASTQKYGESNEITQGWQRSVNEATAKLNTMERELKQNTETMKAGGKEVTDFGDKIKANLTSAAVIAGVVALGKAVKDVAQGTAELAKGSATYADDILTLSAQTGVATDTLQELKYMEELTDVATEDVTKSMAKNIKSMYNAQKGTKDYADAYKKLKVDAIDPTTGALRDSETVYWEVIDALGAMENETEADAIAMLLFGRSAQELNPLIAIGSQGIKEYAKEAQNMGAVLSDDVLSSLGAADDKLQRANQTMEIAKRKIGAELAPIWANGVSKMAAKVSDMDDELADLAGNGMDLVIGGLEFILDNYKPIIAGLTGIGAGFAAYKVGGAAVALAASAQSLFAAKTATATGAVVAQNAAMAASPVGLIAAGIGILAGGMTLLALNAKSATNEYSEFNEKAEQSLNSIKSSIKAREDSANAIESEHGAYRALADELYNLSETENLSNEQKTKMVALVSELNNAMPNLNLTLDEETGLLNKQKNEINKLIDANLKLYKVKAAQESLTQISKDQYNAEQLLNEQMAKRVQLENDLASRRNDTSGITNSAQVAKWNAEIRVMEKQLKDTVKQINNTKDTITDLGIKRDRAVTYIADNGDVVKSANEIGNAIDKMSGKYKTATESMGTYMYELRDKIGAVKNEYATALEDRADEIKNSLGLFSKVTNEWSGIDEEGNAWFSYEKLKESGKVLKDNLEDQVELMKQYDEDMDALGNRNISKGLLDELSSMGLGAANEINALNNLTDEELSEYDRLWQEKSEIATELAEAELTKLKTETDTQLAGLEDIYYQRGKYAAEGYIKGLHEIVDEKKLAVRAAMQGLLDDDVSAGWNETTYGPPTPKRTDYSSSWIEMAREMVRETVKATMENYKGEVILDDDKVGEFSMNKVAREMYTK